MMGRAPFHALVGLRGKESILLKGVCGFVGLYECNREDRISPAVEMYYLTGFLSSRPKVICSFPSTFLGLKAGVASPFLQMYLGTVLFYLLDARSAYSISHR